MRTENPRATAHAPERHHDAAPITATTCSTTETDAEREARWARQNCAVLDFAQELARSIEAAREANPCRNRAGSRYADRCTAGTFGR